MTCEAILHECVCGLDEHPATVAHECATPDPQCGGSWLDHPHNPDLVLIVRYPGIRGGPAQERAVDMGVTDPPPGHPAEEERPDTSWARTWAMLGLPDLGPLRVPRGPIKFIPVPGQVE